MSRRLVAALTALIASAGAVSAQETSATPAPRTASVSGVVVTAHKPTHLAGVTVTAPDWCPEPDPVRHPSDVVPTVMDSYPEPGAVVAPGFILVRISFDAPMSCYSEVTAEGGATDPCQPDGTWELPDRRSWIMQCKLEAATAYKLYFHKVDGAGFVGLSGRRAHPFELDFTTSNGAPITSPEAAQQADPGPPGGAAPTAAYVTCTDQRDTPDTGDCRHETFRQPSH